MALTRREIKNELRQVIEGHKRTPYTTRVEFAVKYNISINTIKQWVNDIRHGPRRYGHRWIAIIIELLGSRCAKCGDTKNLQIHHIIPLAEGGKHTFSNLRLLCKECHRQQHWLLKHQNHPEY